MEERIEKLLATGLKLYGFESDEIIIQKKINDNWHGNYHYKILTREIIGGMKIARQKLGVFQGNIKTKSGNLYPTSYIEKRV